MMIDRDIVKFCSIECRLQQSGELSVGWMVDAWLYAQEHCFEVEDDYEDPLSGKHRLPDLQDILNIASLVEPNVTLGTWRNVDVRVGWDVKMPWQEVAAFMVDLVERLHNDDTLTNQGFIYQSLGVCHPFRDGNGRTHQILWNWLEGTLDNPTWHKDFWNDPRRTVGYGA